MPWLNAGFRGGEDMGKRFRPGVVVVGAALVTAVVVVVVAAAVALRMAVITVIMVIVGIGVGRVSFKVMAMHALTNLTGLVGG